MPFRQSVGWSKGLSSGDQEEAGGRRPRPSPWDAAREAGAPVRPHPPLLGALLPGAGDTPGVSGGAHSVAVLWGHHLGVDPRVPGPLLGG